MCLIRGPVKAKQQFKLDKNSIFCFEKSLFPGKKNSLCQNIILNKNCHFYFAETWFSTVNASFCLNEPHFWFKMLFWILNIAILKEKCNFHSGQWISDKFPLGQYQFCYDWTAHPSINGLANSWLTYVSR